jgi:antitoxin (DNA-binding transcriptional repressor) of toxin-antitoxin stability system
MTTLTIHEAQARLPDLVRRLAPGSDVLITENDRPVARLCAEVEEKKQPRKAGSAKGILTIVRENDDHLTDFVEYMP